MGANLSLPTPLRNDWMGVVSLAQPVAEWFVSRIDRNRKNRAEHGNGSKAKAPPAPEPNDRKEQVVVKTYYTGIGRKKVEQDLESGMQAALKRIKGLEAGLHSAMQRIESLEEDNAKMRRSLNGLLQGKSPPTTPLRAPKTSEDEPPKLRRALWALEQRVEMPTAAPPLPVVDPKEDCSPRELEESEEEESTTDSDYSEVVRRLADWEEEKGDELLTELLEHQDETEARCEWADVLEAWCDRRGLRRPESEFEFQKTEIHLLSYLWKAATEEGVEHSLPMAKCLCQTEGVDWRTSKGDVPCYIRGRVLLEHSMVKELRELRDGEELRKDVQLALKRRAAQATKLMDAWYAQLDVGHVRRMAPADFKLDEELADEVAEEVAEELIGSLEEEGQEEDDEEPDFGGWMNRRIQQILEIRQDESDSEGASSPHLPKLDRQIRVDMPTGSESPPAEEEEEDAVVEPSSAVWPVQQRPAKGRARGGGARRRRRDKQRQQLEAEASNREVVPEGQ